MRDSNSKSSRNALAVLKTGAFNYCAQLGPPHICSTSKGWLSEMVGI